MPKLYVTGWSGFVGKHLELMIEAGELGEVTLVRSAPGLDVRDLDAVRADLAAAAPDWVLHLAARSFIPDAFADPRTTFDVNALGTLNVLMALRELRFTGRMLFVSSGDVYGMVDESVLPVRETTIPDPRNPYAVSKVSAELMCRQWHITEGMDVLCARPFNHIGPLQEPRFVVPGIARQLARMALGQQEKTLTVGDIDVTRDFSDVRDVLRAYTAALTSGMGGATYNVSSGQEVTIRSVIGQLCEIAGVYPEIVVDPSRIRPNEQRRMVASSDRLRQDTGWRPAIPLRQSLEQTYESFRKDETL